MAGARPPRTIEHIREFMRKNGPLPSTVIATCEPVSIEVERRAEQVAQRLVGGLAAGGSAADRVGRLATKLAKLIQVDSAATESAGARSGTQRRSARV